MSKIRTNAGVALGSIGAALPVLVALLWLKPPDLIRVGAGYTAKMVCSNVFLAGRDTDEVLRTDVQAPGHPLLRLMQVSVDRERGVVRAGLFGFIGGGLAVMRPGAGCAVLPDGRLDETFAGPGPGPGPTPDGDAPRPDASRTEPSLAAVLANDALAGPGMRAIVVVRDGHIVGERYAEGFGSETPQLGWSMTKSVTAGLIGILIKDGRLSLTQSVGSIMHWPDDDPRSRITVADLMAMSSGLKFNEAYGTVSDATRMLYLEPDMAAFAAAQPLVHPVGSVWSYSSGSAVILSRVFQQAAGADAVTLVRQCLFEPLGMTSAIMETDEQGTLVGSSYMYATPRDWARFGELLADDGLWQGREILPRGYVATMIAPVAASGGEYGHGLVWRWATHGDKPGENPDAAFGIPADAFWMLGHDGQSVAIIPSKHVVIVRLGLTPVRYQYRPEPLVQAVLGLLGHAITLSN